MGKFFCQLTVPPQFAPTFFTGKLLHVAVCPSGRTQIRYRRKYFAAVVSWKRTAPRLLLKIP